MNSSLKLIKLSTGSGDSVVCSLADSFWTRLRGLMGSNGLPSGEGLLIRPCNSIHMFFMKFAVDAVFMDREYRIVKLVSDLKPGQVVGTVHGAWQVLEVTAGDLPESFREGVQLSVK